MIRRRWRIKRAGADRFRLNLPAEERTVLRDLLPQLRSLLSTPTDPVDPRVRRLFPTAYHEDAEYDAEYQRFMREELVASHLASIERVEATLDRNELTEGEALGWVQSINSVRLVLGTMLDVQEDEPGDLDDPGHVLYHYLSGLLDELVEQLSSGR